MERWKGPIVLHMKKNLQHLSNMMREYKVNDRQHKLMEVVVVVVVGGVYQATLKPHDVLYPAVNLLRTRTL